VTRRNVPPPTVPSSLTGPPGPADRFNNPLAPAAPPPAIHTPHTSHTPHTPAPAVAARGTADPAGMVRRTYYYSRAAADALAAAVDQIHYGSHGRIPKHQALDAIINAGIAQADQLAEQLKRQANE
jgi:hypothetical protein